MFARLSAESPALSQLRSFRGGEVAVRHFLVSFMSLPAELLRRIIHPPSVREFVLSGCEIRRVPEDFVVEEIPAYELSGRGEHAWLWIEKRGLSSPELVNRIIRQLGVASKDIGLAGQKDRHAVTRQYCSIPARFADRAEQLNADDLNVLSVTRHSNKLRTGHLRGNRFRLVLRGKGQSFTPDECSAVNRRLAELSTAGIVNYFGRQRFGIDGSTLLDGLKFLRGRLPSDHWPENQSRTLRRLSLSAVQSAVFNLVVAERVESGQIHCILPGDVVIRRNGTKPYLFPEGADPSDVIPAGPMPGPEMPAASAEALAVELRAMETLGLKSRDFERFSRLTSGARRRMLEFPSEASVTPGSDGTLELTFCLPAGTYATTLLQDLAENVEDHVRETA